MSAATIPAYLSSSPAFIVVEQLNSEQWEASSPYGTWRSSGVVSYVEAVSDALWMTIDTGLGVETVDLAGKRLVLQWPERVV